MALTNRRVLVTGGTGFIGSHFLALEPAQRHEIWALRRSGSSPAMPLAVEPNWIDCPMDDIGPDDFGPCDTLVHFAAAGVSPQKASDSDLVYWNVQVLGHLLRVALDAGIQRVVLAGTLGEYGAAARGLDNIPTSTPLLPLDSYAASKACGFALAHAFCVSQGIELVYNRVFSAFGHGQFEGNLWPSLRRAALAGEDFPMTRGDQIRDFIAVEQVAKVFWDSVEMDAWGTAQPLVQNVGTGCGQSVREFAEGCWKKFAAKGQLLPGAIPSREGEPDRYVAGPVRTSGTI